MTAAEIRAHAKKHGLPLPTEMTHGTSAAPQRAVPALGDEKQHIDRAAAVFDDAAAKFTQEKQLQVDAEKWLRLHGASGIVRSRMDRATGTAVGVADFVFGWPKDGRLLFIAAEAKVGRNKPSAAQDAFLTSVKAAGGCAFVFRSIEELKANLP